MKATKKLTVSAMAVALGVAFSALGSVVSVLDLTAATLASLLVAFVYIEVGSPYTWLVWLATSLISFIIFPHSLVWLVYLTLFGIYPILKGYIERTPRPIWWLLKLLYLNAMLLLLAFFAEALTGVPFFGDLDTLPVALPIAYAIMWAVMNLAFVLYDILIVKMVRFYKIKIRPKIERLLK